MVYTVKPVLGGHPKRRQKIGFQDRLLLNAGQKYCRMLQESILQYFQPSLSYHLISFVLSIFEWPLKTRFTVVFTVGTEWTGSLITCIRSTQVHGWASAELP